MIRLNILLWTCLFLVLASCEKNDKLDDSFSINLYQTVWQGTENVYEGEDIIDTQYFVLQFFDNYTGVQIITDEYYNPVTKWDFDYILTDRILTFRGALEGKWNIIENKHDKIVLQYYTPQKHVINLVRQY
ncbi:hypothetical protein QUW47_14605 [Phocaeicola barnesiae]|jgi:hypothetical protein|uniref:hypothetical protein n=1 Tax=Phocaeicola barnesiae TaxID=376804 RepID=UPI0025A33389|nr:hypothetical protein [Phocaeicola barnesiae]MDM8243085.1 hypothetical protein [Phocaeicola barnesiae]